MRRATRNMSTPYSPGIHHYDSDKHHDQVLNIHKRFDGRKMPDFYREMLREIDKMSNNGGTSREMLHGASMLFLIMEDESSQLSPVLKRKPVWYLSSEAIESIKANAPFPEKREEHNPDNNSELWYGAEEKYGLFTMTFGEGYSYYAEEIQEYTDKLIKNLEPYAEKFLAFIKEEYKGFEYNYQTPTVRLRSEELKENNELKKRYDRNKGRMKRDSEIDIIPETATQQDTTTLTPLDSSAVDQGEAAAIRQVSCCLYGLG